ncbi:TonB-dependent receptor [Sunxiuqinia sp. A32]|uniref:TonB-dependent receptor n=1 Tax=Sunxiuqinia sp. A32 TaxID=3461496 RepID=UPI004045BFB6
MKKKWFNDRASCVLEKWLRIMKLTFTILLISFMHLSASVYSQQSKLSLKLKNVTVRDALKEIEDQSDYFFMYRSEEIDLSRIVNLQLENKSIEEIMDHLFQSTHISYEVINRQIVLTNSESGKKLQNLSQQQESISGKVTDSSGQPLPGVTVVIKGTTQGTITDGDGSYSLLDVKRDDILVFSFVGMKSQEIPVNSNSTINVIMEEDAIGIEEVIAIGYGTAKKEDLTGAVKRANIDAFRESPNVSIVESLQGAVTGLNIGQVDAAGENPSILVRGRTTISGNQSVLIVVDGIIYNGSITDLNPSDIESVDILKDPSSMAIYGAQSANGVILITTKKGEKSEKPVFNYKGSYTTQTPSNKLSVLNAEEFMQKSFDVDWEASYLAPEYTELKPNWSYADIVTDPPLREGYLAGTDYDWWGNVTSPGYISDHNLSVSGSTEKVSYFISSGYVKQEGFILNDKFERITTRINLDHNILPWFKIGVQSFASFSDYSGSSPSMSSLTLMAPFVEPKDKNGNYILNPNGANITNPFLAAEANDLDRRNSLFGNFYAKVDIPFVKGLSYRVNFGNNYNWDRKYYSSVYGAGSSGEAYKNTNNGYEWTLDNILTYKKTLLDVHKFDLTLVYGRRERSFERTSAQGSNYNDLSLGYNDLSLAAIQQIFSSAWDESYLYQMARLNYNFKNKYMITSTIRRDGFSGFAKNNKFALFPSVGLGWVLTEENFMNINWLDYLKVRTSYGSNGNLVNRYSSLAKIQSYPAYVFGEGGSTLFGKQITSLSNPDLSWETTSGFNFGLDFAILDSRLKGNLNYYFSTTNDLIFNVSIPSLTGFQKIITNIGKVENRGIELELSANIIQSNDLKWNVDFNISSNKNEIISLIGLDENKDGIEDDLVASGLFIGESINSIYGYESAGIIQLGEDIPEGFYVGTDRIVDQNGDEKIDPTDRVILGRQEPAYQFGILNDLSYKNFTLRFFINSIQGGKDGYLGRNMLDGFGIGDNIRRNNIWKEYNYWTPANPDAKYRRLDQSPAYDYVHFDDRSFIRLKDITVSYKLNPSLLSKIGIKNLKVYLSGKNLLTFTKWKGWDPETGIGLGSGGRPVLKGYSLGIDFSF